MTLQSHLKDRPELRRMILLSMYAEYVEDWIDHDHLYGLLPFGDWAQINGETLLKGE